MGRGCGQGSGRSFFSNPDSGVSLDPWSGTGGEGLRLAVGRDVMQNEDMCVFVRVWARGVCGCVWAGFGFLQVQLVYVGTPRSSRGGCFEMTHEPVFVGLSYSAVGRAMWALFFLLWGVFFGWSGRGCEANFCDFWAPTQFAPTDSRHPRKWPDDPK